MPKVTGTQDVTKGDPPQDEVVTGEVIQADEFAGFTDDDYRREIFVAREAQRRLQAGVDAMEENRDFWQDRAHRAEAALEKLAGEATRDLRKIRDPNGG